MTWDRIDACFDRLQHGQRTALVAYLTVGDPSVEDTTRCVLAALDAGADLVELGVPFSDPTADGPVIAAASYRAIRSGGSLRAALEVARAVRARSEAPLVMMTYYNPVLTFGDRDLPAAAAQAGVDGLLLVDVPPEEAPELRAAAEAAQVAVIPLVAPTTGPDRLPGVIARARGFVYYVSLTGVTGSMAAPLEAAGREARAIGDRFGLPVVVGFGIDTPEKARLVADQGADGVVVGTAIVKAIAAAGSPEARVAAVSDLVGALRRGLDGK
jgi:tryptophan synthase alpha chain